MTLIYILQVTLCLVCFYAFYHFALHKETLFQTNRIYLMSTLLVSLILPLVRIYIEALQHPASVITVPYTYVGSYLDGIEDAITVAPQDRSIPWLYIFQLIYLAGVLVTGIHFINEIRTILVLKRNGKRILISGHECILSSDIKSPFSFFNSIYLPADHQFDEKDLAEILTHEYSHVRERHTLDILLMEIACIGLWLSPMVYIYHKKLREIHEFLADAEVLKHTSWENYASFLIAHKCVGLQHRLSNQMFYSQLKNRIVMMNKQRSFYSARFKYLGLIPILFLALAIFSFREKSISNEIETQRSGKNNADNFSLQPFTRNQPVHLIDSIIIRVTADKKYYLNSKEIPFSFLEQAIKSSIENLADPQVFVYMPKSLMVQDAVDISDIVDKLKIRLVFIIPDLNRDHVNYQAKDTLPETVITALRSNESSKETYNDNKNTREVNQGKSMEEPFTFVEQMPTFPDGMEAMYKYIFEKIKYPALAREQGISGQVIVQFVVSPEGDIQNAKVIRGIGGGCNEEALRIVNEMPSWEPGKHKGRFVPVIFTLPLKFVLQADQIKQEPNKQATDSNENKNYREELQMPLTTYFSPNPADDLLQIEFSSNVQTATIIDAVGRVVWQNKFQSGGHSLQSVDVSKWNAGIYTVQTIVGNQTYASSFTVQH